MKLRVMSEETRKKISASNKGKNGQEKHNHETCRCFACRIYRGEGPFNKNKTWEELIGVERAIELKKALSKKYKGVPRPYLSKMFTGENNPSWKGGMSYEPYSPDFTNKLKDEIRSRDDFCCQVCKTEQNGKNHDIHHIDYNKKNSDYFNIITLCRVCHGFTTIDRDVWRETLSDYQASRFEREKK